jgi:hypothetical protein
MNQTVTQNLKQRLDLEANRQVIRKQTKDNINIENVGLTETLYQNLMLDI